MKLAAPKAGEEPGAAVAEDVEGCRVHLVKGSCDDPSHLCSMRHIIGKCDPWVSR